MKDYSFPEMMRLNVLQELIIDFAEANQIGSKMMQQYLLTLLCTISIRNGMNRTDLMTLLNDEYSHVQISYDQILRGQQRLV